MSTMKNKPVSFNLDNTDDKDLFDYVKNIKNFSGYMKTLIKHDLEFRQRTIKVEVGSK